MRARTPARAGGRIFKISPRASTRALALSGVGAPGGKPGLTGPRVGGGRGGGRGAEVSRLFPSGLSGALPVALVVLGAAASLILLSCQGCTHLPGGRWFRVRRRWEIGVGFGRCWWGGRGLTWGWRGAQPCKPSCGGLAEGSPTRGK